MPELIKLDHQFLVHIGLGHLDVDQQNTILNKLYRVLEIRMGQAVATSLTKNERSTLERLLEEGNSEAAQSYMERVIPDYAFVARTELEFIASVVMESVRRGEVVVSGQGKADD